MMATHVLVTHDNLASDNTRVNQSDQVHVEGDSPEIRLAGHPLPIAAEGLHVNASLKLRATLRLQGATVW